MDSLLPATSFQDRYADAEAPPPIDAHQDWFLLAASEAGGYQNFTFTRKWITCDIRDRDVQVHMPHEGITRRS